MGWRVWPWGRWKRVIPSFVPSPFLVSWLGGAVLDGDRCVRLCKMPAFTLHKEGWVTKPLCRASLAVEGPQTGSSAPSTPRSGLGVGSRSSRPELPWACRVLVLPLLLCQLLPNPTGALQGVKAQRPHVGSLPPPHPSVLVEFSGAKLLWKWKEVGPGPYSPGGLGCAGGQQDKNFSKTPLGTGESFSVGFL